MYKNILLTVIIIFFSSIYTAIKAVCITIPVSGSSSDEVPKTEHTTSQQIPDSTILYIDSLKSDKLMEVTVKANAEPPKTFIIPIAVETINKLHFLHNNSTNFAKTLTSIPGIFSMDIGAGFSKPVIRGLSFNRIAVVDKGIVQQNQQWGADHGLEIDQYDVENVRIHKGPLSLLYGSDAIGGVIEILSSIPPKENILWGDVTLIGKSNNDLIGNSMNISWKHNKWFFKGRLTIQYFGDYRIPADSINYLSWNMPVYNRRVKNTAGSESNISLSAYYTHKQLSWQWHISNISANNGFFPGSHGIPNIERLKHDGSYHNIDMPYATSNHFKIISNLKLMILDNIKFLFDLGFQQNSRKEFSIFHTHYGDQHPPAINPDLELAFKLHTLSTNLSLSINENKQWTNFIGFSTEYQHNTTDGYSFLLPKFDRISNGTYWINTFKFCNHFSLLSGLRYDIGTLRVEGFYDPILAEYLQRQSYSDAEVKDYAWRATNIKKTFHDFSGSIGFVYNIHHQIWRINIGKSFRYPSANELASNGMHHGAFRHEKGNEGLLPEQSYQLDAGYEYQSRKFHFSATPFISYFTNYIFLEPTGKWSILPHSGQIYEYRQAKVWLAGGELSTSYSFIKNWQTEFGLSYIYNLNITDGYPLPFSVPAKTSINISYNNNTGGILNNYSLHLGADYIFAQNRIARNEDKTPAAFLLNFSFNSIWRINKFTFITNLQIHNILNTAYLNHLSFYRKLNAPEPGRNIQLIIKIPFINYQNKTI